MDKERLRKLAQIDEAKKPTFREIKRNLKEIISGVDATQTILSKRQVMELKEMAKQLQRNLFDAGLSANLRNK